MNPATPAAAPRAGIDPHDILFAILLALLSTVLSYQFGVGNQHEQLPIVLRHIDPAYLPGDFFVSTSAAFGPRFYFARFVAWTTGALPLPGAYFVLRLLSDFALALVTLWAAWRLVGADRLGRMIAAALVLNISSFHLGDATELRYELFAPASLAIPGMLLAIALGVLGRPIAGAIVGSAASLPHPLYGVQGAAIAVGTGFCALLVNHRGGVAPAWRPAIVRTAIAAAVLSVGVLVFWWWPYRGSRGGTLPTEELFDIIARFRSPHHYLPSHFRLRDYVTTAVFMAASGLAFERWSRGVSRRTATILILPILAVFLGCVVGTLFTEVWPARSVLTLQPFRLLSVVKWTGYLLLGWLFAEYWRRPQDDLPRPVVAMSLLSPSGSFPLVTGAGLSILRFRHRVPVAISPAFWVAAIAAATALLWLAVRAFDERVRMAAALALVVAFCRVSARRAVAAAVLTLVLALVVVGNRAAHPVVDFAPVRPILTLDDIRDAQADTSRAAAVHTAADAVFVVPPDFGVLRIVGQRALVVDFEAIPLLDEPMREWRERIRQVYGDVEGGGRAAIEALDGRYRTTTDAHLRELARRYGATHAILYADTATALPELYANETYRIVDLRSR